MSEIPSVIVLNAIRPDSSLDMEGVFRYSNLAPAIARHKPYENARLARVWDRDNELEVSDAAQEAAKQYLLMAAQRLQEVNDPARAQLLSERFTQASAELFGLPDVTTAKLLLVSQYDEFSQHSSVAVSPDLMQFLKDEYVCIFRGEKIEAADTNNEKTEKTRLAAEHIGEVIKRRLLMLWRFLMVIIVRSCMLLKSQIVLSKH